MKLVCRMLVVNLVGLGCLVPQAFAQSAYTHVAVVQVKPNSTAVGQWEAAQRDYVAMCKKAGWPSARGVWQTATGNTSEYRILTPLAKLSNQDSPASPGTDQQMSLWVARASSCAEERRTVIIENQADLSIPAKPGRTPALAELVLRELNVGYTEDFINLRRDTMLPAYKKAGADGIFVGRLRYGGSRSLWTTLRLKDSWADIEAGDALREGLGEAGFQRMLDASQDMTKSIEWITLRYRPDLSYTPD